MASPGSVVIQFKAVADKARQDVLNFATSLGRVDDEAKDADRALTNLDDSIDDIGSSARNAKGDVSHLGTELAQADFDQVGDEAERTADRLRVAAHDMARHIDTGAREVDATTDRMRDDLGEAGRESGAEFVGNIAEGIGSGQANLNDIVSGTLGGITNLAATLTGPLGLAVGGAAAGIGLVFAAVKGQSEKAKAQVEALIDSLEEVGDTSSKAAKTAIWNTWLEKMKENRGVLSGIVGSLKLAGIDQGKFKDAITGSADAQAKVRDQLFLTAQQLIRNQAAGEELTEEQQAYLENFPDILKQLGEQNRALGSAEDYFSDLDYLSGETKKNMDKTGDSIDNAGGKADDLGKQLDRATRDQVVNVKWNIETPRLANGRIVGGGAWTQDVNVSPQSYAGPTATAATTQAPAPPTVIVTEEQVYRAVQRLLLRGQARNGRLVVVG